MLLDFGGPVWHASGNSRMRFPPHLHDKLSKNAQDQQSMHIAIAALRDVGDPELGEWIEEGGPGPSGATIWHIRRRLSMKEQADRRIDVIDMRDTEDGNIRLRKLFTYQPELKAHAQRIGEWRDPPA